LQAYGDAGVVKIVKILEREIIYGMQLLGASSVRDLVPDMVSRSNTMSEAMAG
jgi:L-lactate dehydrogenase (cytochrome)